MQTNIVDGGLMTVSQAAKFLSVGRTMLYGEMDAGRLAYCKFGRARRIPRQALIDFATKNLVGGADRAPPSQCGAANNHRENAGESEECCHGVATVSQDEMPPLPIVRGFGPKQGE